MQGEVGRSAVRRKMKWYGREVPPTLTGGGNTSGRMCGRVMAGGLAAIHVLTAGESQMAAGGMFIEPQLPMTHLQAIQENHQRTEEYSELGSGSQWAIGRRR